jgi:DNA ligase-1
LFKPLLAWNEALDLDQIKYPVLVSPKLDGIRATIQDGQLFGRSLKKIRNKYIQTLFGNDSLNGLDGELIQGEPTADDVLRKTTSAVNTLEFEPAVTYHVFDCFGEDGFSTRFATAKRLVDAASMIYHNAGFPNRIKLVPHTQICCKEDLIVAENAWLEQGYEGLMIRSLNGKYKQGRSTLREGYLLKLKRFSDSEAVVLGFKEQLTNDNPTMINELGYTARRTCQANMIPADTLGALEVRDIYSGIEFSISGFDHKTRKEIWTNKDLYINKILKYKHFSIGVKEKPRFPEFLGWRHEDDLSETVSIT